MCIRDRVDTDLGYTWDSYTDPNSVRIGVNWGYTSSQLLSLIHIFGFNMRNNVAHGMLDDQAFQSFKALYIWWFALKFCYLFCGKLQEENRSKINKKLKQLMEKKDNICLLYTSVITMSLFVTAVLEYTESLVAPIVIHFLWNGVSLAEEYPLDCLDL